MLYCKRIEGTVVFGKLVWTGCVSHALRIGLVEFVLFKCVKALSM